jgi:hypothetical protein
MSFLWRLFFFILSMSATRYSIIQFISVVWQCNNPDPLQFLIQPTTFGTNCHVLGVTVEEVWIGNWIFVDRIQIVTTSNYGAITNLHTLQITRAHAKSSQSATVSTSRFLERLLTVEILQFLCTRHYCPENIPQLNSCSKHFGMDHSENVIPRCLVQLLLVKNLLPSSEHRFIVCYTVITQ